MPRTYLQSKEYSLPSQGDYSIQPRVKTFPAVEDPIALDTAVNLWLITTLNNLADGNFFVFIHDIKYQSFEERTAPMAGDIFYTCQVFYDEVTII